MMLRLISLLLFLRLGLAFHLQTPLNHRLKSLAVAPLDRQGFVKELSAATSIAFLWPRGAIAQPKEFSGVDTQAPPADGEAAFESLPSGVKFKVMRSGDGEPVGPGKTASVQVNGRLLNLNGVSFYNTKNNNPDGFGAVPLSIPLGKGVALPGLEEGIVGMRKGEIRRIIVPSELGYSKYPGLEPIPMNNLDQQALDSVVKNPRRDATLLFDVKLEKSK